jgi:hypothetical protein
LHALAPNNALGTIRRLKTTRLKRCDVNASGRPSLRQPRRRYGFNSKRSRTNATVVSAHSIAVATWLRVADVIDDLSRSPVHPVNVKANSRAMTLIRTVYPNSDFCRIFFY